MKRTLSLILSVSIVLTPALGIKADELNDAQKKLNNVNSSISSSQGKLSSVTQNIGDTQKEIDALDSQASVALQNLNNLNSQLESINAQIASTQNTIEKSEQKLTDEQNLFKERMRALYMSGTDSYLEIILDAKGFSDLISRIEDIGQIMDYDNNLIKQLNENEKIVQDKKVALEGQKNQYSDLETQANAQYSGLQRENDQKKSLMTSLQNDKSSYEQMIAEKQKESSNITNIIKQIEASRQKPIVPSTPSTPSTPSAPSNGGSVVQSGRFFCVTGHPYQMTSPYGWRVQPITGKSEFHPGMDLGVPYGTPVYALADGTVIYSGVMSGYGYVVMIDHGDIISLYGHNSALKVQVGQTVKGGQLISYSGSSGLSTGPHLHFEIRNESGNTIDPSPYYVR